MEFIKKPQEIENGSMNIIESEMLSPTALTHGELSVVKRVIHTTADFEYEALIRFKGEVFSSAFRAIEKKCKVYCDTNMISVGVNRINLEKLGMKVVNYVHDKDVVLEAKKREVTRSIVAMEKAVKDEDIHIFLIGNAPTALLTLLEFCHTYKKSPALIVGVPVGFVGAKESKDRLYQSDHTHITVLGRKGGSTVAVAIMNALMKIYLEENQCQSYVSE
jgi:precorrin-8X/cobalt-precorrin-8 methylmutase